MSDNWNIRWTTLDLTPSPVILAYFEFLPLLPPSNGNSGLFQIPLYVWAEFISWRKSFRERVTLLCHPLRYVIWPLLFVVFPSNTLSLHYFIFWTLSVTDQSLVPWQRGFLERIPREQYEKQRKVRGSWFTRDCFVPNSHWNKPLQKAKAQAKSN